MVHSLITCMHIANWTVGILLRVHAMEQDTLGISRFVLCREVTLSSFRGDFL